MSKQEKVNFMQGQSSQDSNQDNQASLRSGHLSQAYALVKIVAREAKRKVLHEVGNLLGGIKALAEDVLETPGASELQHVLAFSSLKSVDAITTILTEEVTSASIGELNRTNFLLAELLEDVRGVLIWKASQKKVDVDCKMMPGAPESICTDRLRLRQALINVVKNAIHATQKGSITVTAEVSDSQSNRLLVIKINDPGCGIAPSKRESLFEAKSMDDQASGMGLGLMISRDLMRSLGGDLALTKTVMGMGSEFTLTVPCV